jgi:hypothetical protein
MSIHKVVYKLIKKGRRRKSHEGKDVQFRNGWQSGRNLRNDLISSHLISSHLISTNTVSPRGTRYRRYLEGESGTISAKLSERSGSLTHLELRGGAQAQFSIQVSHFRRPNLFHRRKSVCQGDPSDALAWRIRRTSFRRNSLSGF